MKENYVADLRHGMSLNGETFAIKEAALQKTKAGKPFYRITLQDKTGSLNGQIWSDHFAAIDTKAIVPGRVVMVDAQIEDYRGTPQINITRLSGVDESALEEFVEASDFDLDELWQELQAFIQAVESETVKKFLQVIFADESLAKKYKIAPAAEDVHHSFRGGLLEHVMEMLTLASSMRRFYPEVNFDIVTAGIILHDIGKLQELDTVGTVVQRTTAGSLLGHIPQGFEFIAPLADKYLTQEEALNVKHIILSHHGLLEYGSPVKPSTIEAILVHLADNSSSQLRIFQKVLRRSSGTEGDFTEYDRILGTRIYKNKGLQAGKANDKAEADDEQITFA